MGKMQGRNLESFFFWGGGGQNPSLLEAKAMLFMAEIGRQLSSDQIHSGLIE